MSCHPSPFHPNWVDHFKWLTQVRRGPTLLARAHPRPSCSCSRSSSPSHCCYRLCCCRCWCFNMRLLKFHKFSIRGSFVCICRIKKKLLFLLGTSNTLTTMKGDSINLGIPESLLPSLLVSSNFLLSFKEECKLFVFYVYTLSVLWNTLASLSSSDSSAHSLTKACEHVSKSEHINMCVDNYQITNKYILGWKYAKRKNIVKLVDHIK